MCIHVYCRIASVVSVTTAMFEKYVLHFFKFQNQVEEKKLALLDVTHVIDGLQEFCESMEGALCYLESVSFV